MKEYERESPDVVFALSYRGCAAECRAAAKGFDEAAAARGGRKRTDRGSLSVKGIVVDSARERSVSVLLSGVGVVDRAVDPRSRC